ncbi:MAG TPA: hypothetical protein PLF40_25805 [Kofleriaceae bacterium]|nr:hypothetical protein [Kofleriaceae bacterium]
MFFDAIFSHLRCVCRRNESHLPRHDFARCNVLNASRRNILQQLPDDEQRHGKTSSTKIELSETIFHRAGADRSVEHLGTQRAAQIHRGIATGGAADS